MSGCLACGFLVGIYQNAGTSTTGADTSTRVLSLVWAAKNSGGRTRARRWNFWSD